MTAVGDVAGAAPAGPGDFTLVRTQTGRPAWQVNGHANVKSMSRDPRLTDSDPTLVAGRADATTSGAEHVALARAESLGWSNVLRRAFSPERVDGLRPRMDAAVRELLQEMMEGQRPADLHASLSVPLITVVTCALLDIPLADGLRLRSWWDAVRSGTREQGARGQADILAYVRALIRERDRGGQDFVSTLVSSLEGNPNYANRAVKFLTSLVSKGRETPINAMDWGFVLLLRDEDPLFRRLVADPSMVDPAVDEALRLFPVISGRIQGPEGIRRFALTRFDGDAAAVDGGDLVLLNVVSANMDRAVFPDPDRFDPRRAENPHLTFGFGPHACPASRLARLQMQVAVAAVVQTLPGLGLAVSASRLRFKERPTSDGFEEIPVRW